jgi:hypothetical protein
VKGQWLLCLLEAHRDYPTLPKIRASINIGEVVEIESGGRLLHLKTQV